MDDVNEKNLAQPFQGEDILLPFQLEASGVRGRLVRLGGSLDLILGQHRYPSVVGKLLAEATSMAAALGTALKFDGIFTIQTKTDGPINRLVVDVTSDGAVRACAQFEADKLGEGSDETAKLLGRGHLVFTVDQTLSDERYQGIVQLEGNSLVEAFQLYFRQSEQIPTGLVVAARQDEGGHWHAGCLMVQRMPSEGGTHEGGTDLVGRDTSLEDDWLRTMALMQTCTAEELTDPDLPSDQLLFRLFHEEVVRVFDVQHFRHECRCSREKIEGVLVGLPKEELAAMAQEDGQITVTCSFCGNSYGFDKGL